MIDSAARPSTILTITDSEFSQLSSFVYKTYGIDLSKKRQLIEGRLSYTLRKRGLTNFGQYMDLLKNDRSGAEIDHFLNKITTNHSYFARGVDHFEFLRNTILPEVEKRGTRDLRTWSAGCSAGQEAYNIAMTYAEYFGERKKHWDTTILASDISIDVLKRAQQAVYPFDQLKDLSPELLKKYFTKRPDGSMQVCDKLRKEVVFRIFNLMEPFSHKKQFDVIFCRNVMIYFDPPTIQRLIDKFYQALIPGGYLFIGHSESLSRCNTPLTFAQPAIYQKPKGGTR